MSHKTFICLVLIAATLAVFWQVSHHEFVNFDDDEYVTENIHLQKGLTSEGFTWAFTSTHAANWHPLTWLSHMLDYHLYGLDPKGHHLTNLLFHLANTILLFLVLGRMTATIWQSALVAALFSLHPLHVESVAWVAERKDVLSTFFWMLTMWAYVRHVERPALSRYLLTLCFFGLGLLAKPMLVTLPFVLLLLDYWPLQRFRVGQATGVTNGTTQLVSSFEAKGSFFYRLVGEKAAFFALAAVSSVVTFLVQRGEGAVGALEVYPLKIRLANALVSYVSYIGKMILPRGLAVFYPHPGSSLLMWYGAGAGLLLVGITLLVLRTARRYPYLLVGWLWYLGTLVPVIGLVQVGEQAMADRYTYVPLIGLFIMIAWGIPELMAGWRHRRLVLGMGAGTLLSTLMICTWLQVQHWQNSTTLFEHALRVTSKNSQMHNNLGNVLTQQGKLEEAITHYRQALKIKPKYADAHSNLGVALAHQGRLQEALAHYYEAVRLKPNSPEARNNLGVALVNLGRINEAIEQYVGALQLAPDYAEAHNNLGDALARQGKLHDAAAQFSRALEIRPDYAQAHNNLGVALARQGELEEAIPHFREALRLKPNYVQARANLQLALQEAGRSPGDPDGSPSARPSR